MENVCSVSGMVEEDGRCVEPKNWIVENRTFIFGGGKIFQPNCGEKREEILKRIDAVKEPREFLPGGKCFGRNVGKIVTDDCSRFLKDGIAFVESKKNLKVGMGHGGLLGGLDKELTFIPTTENVCREAENLDKERKKLDSWELNEQIPKGVIVSESDKRQIDSCKRWREKIEKIDGRIMKELPNCTDMENTSSTSMSAKCKPSCDLSAFEKSDNIDELERRGITHPDTIKSELKYWGEKPRDIKRVYHNTETPFIVEMKDGNRFVFAPKITKRSDDCDQIERYLKNEMRKKAENINSQISDLLEEHE